MDQLSPILTRLRELKLEIENLKHVEEHLTVVKQSLKNHYSSLEILEQEVLKEEKSLDKLEGRTVTSMFRNILGDKEKQLEKQRQEYLETSLKYNDSKESVELLEFEQEILQKKLLNKPKLNKEFEELKRAREKEILTIGNPETRKKMQSLMEELEKNVIFQQELEEAIIATKRSLEELNYINHHLNKAKDWGQWDMMQSKGRNLKYAKFQAIDRAKSHIPACQHRLNILKRELRDIGYGGNSFTINLDQMSSFSNMFFDNIISDWLFQQKILNSLKSVQNLIKEVEQVNRVLHERKEKILDEFSKMMLFKDELLFEE